MKTSTATLSPGRPHDLLLLANHESLEEIDEAPEWVKQSLRRSQYVVVRRASTEVEKIAVGVRGQARHERFAGTVLVTAVKLIVSPYQIRIGNKLGKERVMAIPALSQLQQLEKLWQNVPFSWGPTGSVGFEIVSGQKTATASSDLDLSISVDSPFDRRYANILVNALESVSPAADALVEGPHCAFSLIEYAKNKSSMMLRFPDGPRLGRTPWQVRSSSDCD